MDPWVNSLVQSPLVRSLNTVPSRMSSFAHGVKDNVPPFSFSRVVVNPPSSSVVEPWEVGSVTVSSTSSIVNQPVRFDIPMFGLLDRAYLLVRAIGRTATREVINQPLVQASGAGYTQGKTLDMLEVAATVTAAARRQVIQRVVEQTPRSTSLNFADAIDRIELRGNTKSIETLFPASIASEVQKMPSALRQFYYKTLTGFSAGSGVSKFNTLWDPAAGVYDYNALLGANGTTNAVEPTAAPDHTALLTANSAVDFLIPLPFSTLHQLKDNYQTRFVEPLHISVTPKSMVHLHQRLLEGSASGNNGYRMSLVCYFHNFHDVIENSIRDQNYKRGFPASIYGYNFNQSVGTISNSGSVLSVPLTGKELIDTVLVQIRRRTPVVQGEASVYPTAYQTMSYAVPVATTNAPTYGQTVPPIPLAEKPINFFFSLKGSGREIWSGWDFELTGPSAADFELADGHPYGEDLAGDEPDSRMLLAGNPREPVIGGDGSTKILSRHRSGKVLLGFSHAMYAIKLGLQSNQNFYTGGLALQTISNPTLEVTAFVEGTATDIWTSQYTVDVTLRHSQMIRIDSDTGVITTTLTS